MLPAHSFSSANVAVRTGAATPAGNRAKGIGAMEQGSGWLPADKFGQTESGSKGRGLYLSVKSEPLTPILRGNVTQ